MLGSIWLARQINSQVGGVVVAPWEVGELPGDWVDAFMGMATDVPRMAQGKAQVESALDKWRKSVSRNGRS
jgi:hypothetical protein